jgi:hypothetical protein
MPGRAIKRRLEGGVDSSSSSLPTAVGTSSSDASRRLACRELSELTGPVIYVTLEALSPSTKRYRMQVATRVVLPFWLFAALMVLAFRAGIAIGPLRYAHSVFCFGLTDVAGLSSRYPVLILLGDSSIARFRVSCRGSAVGALRHARSVLGLGFTTSASLSGCYSILILLGDGSIARFRVHSSGSLTIAANGLTAQVLDAILCK